MIVYTRERVARLLTIDFIRFCIVGGTGFVINFVILTLGHRVLDLPIFAAQLIGAEIALFSNFMLHHHWTYKANKVQKTFTALLIQFHTSTWVAILGSALMVSLFVNTVHLSNFWALVLSSLIALFWNFGWSKFVIWRDVSSKEVEGLVK